MLSMLYQTTTAERRFHCTSRSTEHSATLHHNTTKTKETVLVTPVGSLLDTNCFYWHCQPQQQLKHACDTMRARNVHALHLHTHLVRRCMQAGHKKVLASSWKEQTSGGLTC